MRSYTIKNRTKFWIKLTALLLLAAGVFVFLRARKDALMRECVHWFERTLSDSAQMEIRVGRVHGNLLGFVSLQDLTINERGAAPEETPMVRIKEAQLHYRFLDFLSKKFDSELRLAVKEPQFHWKPYFGLRRPNFPFFTWMRDWAITQKDNFLVEIEDMSFVFDGYKRVELGGVDISLRGDSFNLQIPISHAQIGRSDVTTLIAVNGRFDLGSGTQEDMLSGQIRTEGTVIDWKPLSEESIFNFVFTRSIFQITSIKLLGGIQLDGAIDFTRDYDLSLNLLAKDVPMSEIGFFVRLDKSLSTANRFDLEANFNGSLMAPHVGARARIYNGWIGSRAFKAMDVNVDGVYPTVTLNNSRILLEDGSSMVFADKTLEISDLARGSTFDMLVKEAQQDTVVWGDWEFSRPHDSEDRPEFFMQRLLGPNARVHFRKTDEDQVTFKERETQEMEVGFEYKLQGKDSLKVEYRDDQEVVGIVERKLRF